MFKKIEAYISDLTGEFNQIPEERKLLLENLARYISVNLSRHSPVNLVYICTHNSRRSHFGQVWAKVASEFYGIPDVQTYSGGTEATSFNRNAVNTLMRIGFHVEPINFDSN